MLFDSEGVQSPAARPRKKASRAHAVRRRDSAPEARPVLASR